MCTNYNIKICFVSLSLAFIVVTVFSFTTSFLFDRPLMYDSAVFQLIGKNWAEGRLPYRDLWELKGPAIFLPNAIGYWSCGSKFGVYLLQLVNMSIAFFFILKLYSLEFKMKKAVVLTFISVFYFLALYEAGNSVEEYFLPLQSCAFYYLYKFVDGCIINRKCLIPSSYSFLFGVILGYSLMSRLTNAVPICVAIVMIGFLLVRHKEWHQVVKSVSWFVLGFLALTVPFFIYFYEKGALEEMWYGTFLFGLEYAGNSGFEIFSLFGLRHILLRFANCYLLLFTSIMVLKYNSQRKFAGWMWLSISVLSILMFLRLNPFGHYYLITLPFTAIVFIEIHKLMMFRKEIWYNVFFRAVIAIYVVCGIVGIANNVKNYFAIFHDYKSKELAVYNKIINKIPSDFRSSFIAFNCDTEFYLYYDIPPKYPYYTNQGALINYGPSIKTRIESCFKDGDARFLVVYSTPPKWLQRIITDRYHFLFSEKSTRKGEYNVYQKNTN